MNLEQQIPTDLLFIIFNYLYNYPLALLRVLLAMLDNNYIHFVRSVLGNFRTTNKSRLWCNFINTFFGECIIRNENNNILNPSVKKLYTLLSLYLMSGEFNKYPNFYLSYFFREWMLSQPPNIIDVQLVNRRIRRRLRDSRGMIQYIRTNYLGGYDRLLIIAATTINERDVGESGNQWALKQLLTRYSNNLWVISATLKEIAQLALKLRSWRMIQPLIQTTTHTVTNSSQRISILQKVWGGVWRFVITNQHKFSEPIINSFRPVKRYAQKFIKYSIENSRYQLAHQIIQWLETHTNSIDTFYIPFGE